MQFTTAMFIQGVQDLSVSQIFHLCREVVHQNNISTYRLDLINDGTVGLPTVKIVTFFDDAAHRVAGLLGKEFKVYSENTANGSDACYSFTAGLPDSRIALPEYKNAANTQIIFQISSVMKDMVSSLELELARQGVTAASAPKELTRFSMLLEMADQEFAKIMGVTGKTAAVAITPTLETPVQEPEAVASTTGALQPAEIPATSPASQDAEPYADDYGYTGYVTPAYNYKSASNIVASQPAAVITPAVEVEKKAELPPVEEVADVAEDLTPLATEQEESVPEAATTEFQAPAEGEGISLTTFDMSVNDPNKLSINVGNYENLDATEEEPGELMNDQLLPMLTDEENPQALLNTDGATTTGDGVALNIDNIETFNLNVNGMLERRTEVVVDKSADENVPFFEREKKPAKPIVLDENAQLNDPILREYVATSSLVKEVDSEIARRAGAVLNTEVDVEGDVERLKFLKVHTLKQLHERIEDNQEDIVAFAEKWIGTDNGGSFDSGICLFYLEYLLVGKRNDPAFAVEYVLKFISDNDYSARFIIPTYNSISNNDMPIASHLTIK